MKRYPILGPVTASIAIALVLCGCTSTAQRATLEGGGAAAGAVAGAALGGPSTKGRLIGAGAGGLVGGLGTALALGPDKDVYQQGVDTGYVQATSDDVKKLYWAKQALETRAAAGGGVLRYYSFEDEGTTADGRKLAPETVAIPVYEPVRQ